MLNVYVTCYSLCVFKLEEGSWRAFVLSCLVVHDFHVSQQYNTNIYEYSPK